MSLDPFAAPAPEPEPAASSLPATDKPATTVARPSLDEGKVVVTLKGGPGFEAPWIVIHAGSPAEADALLNTEMLELMGKVQRAAETFRGSAPVSSGAPAPNTRPSQPAQSTQAPAGAPESPGPGWEFKTGVTKAGRNAGKPWKAWMPPRGSSESPVFFD